MQLAYGILAWLPFDRFQETVASLRWDAQGAISVRRQLRGGLTPLGSGDLWYRYSRLCTFQGELTKWSERPVGRQFLMCRAVFLGKNAYASRLLRQLTWAKLSLPVVDFLLRSGDDELLKNCPPEILVRLSLPDVGHLPRAWQRLYQYLGQSRWWQLKDKNLRAYFLTSIKPEYRPRPGTVGVDGSPELERYLSFRSPVEQVKWLLKRVYPELLRSRLASCSELPTVYLAERILAGKICLTPDLAERARAVLALLPSTNNLYAQTLRILAGEPVAEHWLQDILGLKPLLLAVAHPQVQSETFRSPRSSSFTINRGGLFHDVVNYFRASGLWAVDGSEDLLLELFARGQAWRLLEHPNWPGLAVTLTKE